LSHEGRTELFDDGTYDYQRARAGQRRFHTFENYRVGPLEFGAIERLVTDAQSAGAFVVLLELPYMRKALASIIPSGEARLNEFHELLARTATRLDLPLLTQRDMMNRGEFFADFYHPNAKGTRLLSTRTGAWLANALPQDPTPVTGH
jgi:hypothetical protein